VSGDTTSRRYVLKRIIFELEPEPEPCTEEQVGSTGEAEPEPEPLITTSKNKIKSKVRREGFKLDDVPPYEDLLRAVRRAYHDVNQARYRLRDLALVAVLIYTGCRLGEVLSLTRDDIDFENKAIRIKQGKEEPYRVVPVQADLFWTIMERYLRRLTGDQLFTITERQARNIVYKFAKRYLGRKIRPHAIRHSYAIALARKVMNLEELRRLLGYADYKHVVNYLLSVSPDIVQEIEKGFKKWEEGK